MVESLKKGQVNILFNIVSGIKLNEVSDKEARRAIMSNYVAFKPISEKLIEDVKAIRTKLFEGKDERVNNVSSLRREYNEQDTIESRKNEIIKEISEEYKDIIDLEQEYGTMARAEEEKDVQVNVIPFDEDVLIDTLTESGMAFTVRDLAEEPISYLIRKETAESGKCESCE